MNIKEIKEKQCKLENAIFYLIHKFNEETNVRLATIDLEIIDLPIVEGPKRSLHRLKTTIEI